MKHTDKSRGRLRETDIEPDLDATHLPLPDQIALLGDLAERSDWLLARIFAEANSGMTPAQIADHLNSDGVPRPAQPAP